MSRHDPDFFHRNESQDLHPGDMGWTRRDCSVIVKYSYLFDIQKWELGLGQDFQMYGNTSSKSPGGATDR